MSEIFSDQLSRQIREIEKCLDSPEMAIKFISQGLIFLGQSKVHLVNMVGKLEKKDNYSYKLWQH